MNRIAIVCGSFHQLEIEKMLEYAKDSEIAEVVWVAGSMEIPLALDRLLVNDDIDGAVCLSIIEKGETEHGAAMGNAVIKTILELQLVHNKPIGLGIIGPGAEPHHIEVRLEPHARAAVSAIASFL
jgi:6,7-dimethyl-8-ribityllumazine synthase